MTTTTIEQLKVRLAEVFEPALVDEILEHEILYEKAGTIFDNAAEVDGYPDMVPLVVDGRIRTLRHDAMGNEMLIYELSPVQGCILSITSAMRGSLPNNMLVRIEEDSAFFAIPPKKAAEWMNVYESWRMFAVGLYETRLGELLTQHDVIIKQKDEIAMQKQEITDSIQYAQRIQKAMLPQDDELDEALHEYFTLYIPRDIVSGDYYWMRRFDNRIIVVAADCTGHGVPGAFMSMLGVSFLNEITGKNSHLHANEILNQLRDMVIASLHQTGKKNEAKDGMDLSLYIIDYDKMELEFSGAFNPLYRIRDGELTEFKANKMPIAIFVKMKPFENQVIQIEKGDVFYNFSDGFVDQFGGPKGRKYLSKRFKKLLLDVHQHPLSTQQKILNREIQGWIGMDHQQVDDVLVIGVKV